MGRSVWRELAKARRYQNPVGRIISSRRYLAKHVRGGPKTSVMAADCTVTKFMRPIERRSHHVRFVLMQVMTSSSHACARDRYVRNFLDRFRVQYTPPAPATVTHDLTELASFVSTKVFKTIADLQVAYNGAPWAHICTDLWTPRHLHQSYGSIVLRFTDIEHFKVKELSLGVWKCAGKHDHVNTRARLSTQLDYFGMSPNHVATSTTDSGANVRKAMRSYGGQWVPCAAHSLHNAARHALGGSGEMPNQKQARVSKEGAAAARSRKACRNAPARELLGRLRGTIRFFGHSDAEAQRLSNFPVVDDPFSRRLLPDVVTRWGSTYRLLCSIYSMWPRLSVYFRSLSAEQRTRRVSQRDWDRLRHIIAVLTSAHEGNKMAQSSTASLAEIFTLLVSLRQMMLAETVTIPKFPELPHAVGGAAIEAFLTSNPTENDIEVDDRLYWSENASVDERPGYECLCQGARSTVPHLRSELDRLFFNVVDEAKNWLRISAVLTAVTLTPGGTEMLREGASWLGFEDPTARARSAILTVAAKLQTEPAHTTAVASLPLNASGRGTVSQQRGEASSSLLLWGGGRGGQAGGVVAATSEGSSVDSELLKFERLSRRWSTQDAHAFWATHREQFPSLYFIAASAL